MQLIARAVEYGSPGDETAFFDWLGAIACVGVIGGVGPDLLIPLTREPSDEELRELIALFHRYGVSLGQLAVFNRDWLLSPDAFWFSGMFGSDRDA